MKKQPATKRKLSFAVFVKIVKDTFRGFSDDQVTKLSASLAYATLFSIIPFLSLLIAIGTLFQADLGTQLFTQLQSILGGETVDQLQGVIGNAAKSNSSTLAMLVSLGVTIFGATAIFAEMQSSLNTIWGIKAIPKKGWLKFIRNRLLSFSIILVFAFILLITFGISTAITTLSGRILSDYPDAAASTVKMAGFIVNLGITTLIFTLMFKMLPDAKIKTRDILVGAFVTTLLFLAGQWGISLYIGMAQVGSVYGAAAFVAILITWIYYSAIIIYIGAEFTEAWANEMGGKIVPDEFAVATKIIEIQSDKPVGSVNKIVIRE